MTRRATAAIAATAAMMMSAAGCVGYGEANPTLALREDSIYAELDAMADDPVELERPVLFVGSYHGADFHVGAAMRKLIAATSGDISDFARVPTWFDDDFDTMVRRAVDVAAERFGLTEDGAETVEIDVVGLSLGGLIARAAAIPADGRPRLRIRNLYTIASPHRGANLAKRIAPDALAKQLRPGSDLIGRLDEAYPDRDYTMFPYGITNDGVVGVINTAPPGERPIWTRGMVWGSHLNVAENRVIRADIARRLRGEAPILTPGEPLPAYH